MNHLSPNAQLLFFKLFLFWNKTGFKKTFKLDNTRLMGMVGCHSVNTVIKIREELLKNHLIFYEKGRKGSPNIYEILTENLEEKTLIYSSKYELKDEKYSSYFDTKPELKPPINSSNFDTKTAPIVKHKQINHKLEKTVEEKRREKAYLDLEKAFALNPWEDLKNNEKNEAD